MWDDYHVFLIATLVFTRLLLDEIYHLIELPFEWLTDDAMSVCLPDELILGFCYCDLTLETGGFQLASTITLVLQVNRLTNTHQLMVKKMVALKKLSSKGMYTTRRTSFIQNVEAIIKIMLSILSLTCFIPLVSFPLMFSGDTERDHLSEMGKPFPPRSRTKRKN